MEDGPTVGRIQRAPGRRRRDRLDRPGSFGDVLLARFTGPARPGDAHGRPEKMIEKVPKRIRRAAYRALRWPPIGWVRFGSLRRLSPISRVWGFDRGGAVDRYYIEGFLARHSGDVNGRVLEVANNEYTLRFGGKAVERSDVLHPVEGSERATIVGDLAVGEGIPSGAFDCVICTQTLQLVFDVPAALSTIHRALKPGGVLLATVPGISQISREDMDQWGDFWRFTTASAERLAQVAFPGGEVSVEAHGNVLTSIAFLEGIAAEELSRRELDHLDPDYQMLLTIRASKSSGAA